ncbi:MAG: hypothetical protein NVS3B6_11090 [Pseudarthrobacter sp.]
MPAAAVWHLNYHSGKRIAGAGHPEHHATPRNSSSNTTLQTEPDTALLKVGQLVNQLTYGPAGPVDPPHDECVPGTEFDPELPSVQAGSQASLAPATVTDSGGQVV